VSEETFENLPCEQGESLGKEVARLTDSALLELKKDFPNQQERCKSCAFRLGTLPNRSLATLHDAIKCLNEYIPFMCHEDSGKSLCAGYSIAMSSFEQVDGATANLDWMQKHD